MSAPARLWCCMTSSLTEGADHSHRCAQRAAQRAGAARGPVSLNGSAAAVASRSGSLEAVGGLSAQAEGAGEGGDERRVVLDDVYTGLRCAVCQHRFAPGEVCHAVPGRAERTHVDAPDGCPPIWPAPTGPQAAGAGDPHGLEHVYPLPAGEDPRFSLALLVGVGAVLERHGFPTPAPLDWVELQEALGRFLFRERDVEVRQTGGAR